MYVRDVPVPEKTDVFRYRSTGNHVTTGVPTGEQSPALEQDLIEIDGVYRANKGGLYYTGLQSWIGMAQLIHIEEVPHYA